MARYKTIIVDPTNLSDSATFTASSESGEHVVGNLQDQRPSRVWRSTNDTAANTKIKIDLGAAVAVNALVFSHHNFTVDATLNVYYADSDLAISSGSWTLYTTDAQDIRAPEYGWGEGPWGAGGWYGYATEDSLPGYIPIYYLALTKQPIHRYWKIEFTDESNPDGYVQIGRLALDVAWEFPNGIYWGYNEGIADISPVGRTGQGSFYSNALAKYRKIDGLRTIATPAQWEDFFLPIAIRKGTTRDLYLLIDESKEPENRHIMRRHYGRFTQGTIPQWQSGNIGMITLGFEQAL